MTASLLLSIALLLDFDWWFAVLGACAFGAVNWWIWRGNGPAHRWRAALIRRFSRE